MSAETTRSADESGISYSRTTALTPEAGLVEALAHTHDLHAILRFASSSLGCPMALIDEHETLLVHACEDETTTCLGECFTRYSRAAIRSGVGDSSVDLVAFVVPPAVQDVSAGLSSWARLVAHVTDKRASESGQAERRRDLMYELLTGTVDEGGGTAERADLFGWNLNRELVTIVIEFGAGDESAAPPQDAAESAALDRAIMSIVRERDRSPSGARFAGQFVVLTGSFSDRPAALEFVESLRCAADAFSQSPVRVGLSRPVHTIEEIPRGYRQASQALRLGLGSERSSARIFHFDELGVFRILAQGPEPAELQRFADDVLADLLQPTARMATLKGTLEALIGCRWNVAATARDSHYHYNTLRAQVEAIERIVGPVTKDPTLRFEVELALRVAEFLRLPSDPRPPRWPTAA